MTPAAKQVSDTDRVCINDPLFQLETDPTDTRRYVKKKVKSAALYSAAGVAINLGLYGLVELRTDVIGSPSQLIFEFSISGVLMGLGAAGAALLCELGAAGLARIHPINLPHLKARDDERRKKQEEFFYAQMDHISKHGPVGEFIANTSLPPPPPLTPLTESLALHIYDARHLAKIIGAMVGILAGMFLLSSGEAPPAQEEQTPIRQVGSAEIEALRGKQRG